jgi:hypothetical protein
MNFILTRHMNETFGAADDEKIFLIENFVILGG